MRGELAPIGVVYGLDYLALRPAYHVKLKIDWDRVQDIMDTNYGQEGLFTSRSRSRTRSKSSRTSASSSVRGGHVRARGRRRQHHRAARRSSRARARHDHRRVLRELDRSAAPGARRMGQGGRHHQVVLAAALRADGRLLLQEDALFAHRLEAARRGLLGAHHAQALDLSAGPPVRPVSRARRRASTSAASSSPSTPTIRGSSAARCASFRAPTSSTIRCGR